MITEFDRIERRCPRLGHQITFRYCRSSNAGSICLNIVNCWFDRFSIEEFLHNHYSDKEMENLRKAPKPKLCELVELIQKAKTSGQKC